MFKKTLFLIFAIMVLFALSFEYVSAKNVSSDEQITAVNNEMYSASEKAQFIDKYQMKYFEIVKRNNVLLNFEDDAALNKDRKELEKLFSEVQKQITNKKYLQKYNKIQKRFSNCDEITTTGINEFAEKNYNAINKLLNSTYKKAEAKLNFEDAKKLALSQIDWEKEVENYKKVYDSTEFGTIGTSTYYGYEINMREFRTLLLIMLL